MHDTQDQDVAADYQPHEQERKPDAASVARNVFFAVLVVALGAIVGILVARFAMGDGASAAGSPQVVATATPDVVAPPTPVTPPTTVAPQVVVAKPATGRSGRSADDRAPATPKLISPPDGAIVGENGTKLTLEWSKVTDPSGVRYRVQIQQWLGGGAGWADIKLVKGLKYRHYHHTVGAMRERWRVFAADLAGNVSAPTEWRTIVPALYGGGDDTLTSPLQLLRDKKWLLSSISDGAGGMLDPVDGTHASIEFDFSSASGSTGVNTFNAPYTASDTAMHFGSVSQTMMAGSPDAMKQEQYFGEALKKTAKWTTESNGSILKLLGASGEVLAVFQWK